MGASTPVHALGEEKRLDQLLEALKQSESADEAEKIAQQIDIIWRNANGDTANLLLSRADKAMSEENYILALDLLDQLVALEPNFAEAWNRRAEVYYLMEDFAHCLSDLEVTLTLEPRHYNALRGLGLVLEEMGEVEYAYKIFKRSLAIHPFQENIMRELETLEVRVQGHEI